MVKIITSELEFDQILNRSTQDFKLVVIDYFTTWCGPCRQFAPQFESLANKYINETVFVKVDCDDLQEVAVKQNITRLPTVKGYLVGNNVFTISGVSTNNLIREVDKYIMKIEIKNLLLQNTPTKTLNYLLKITDNIINKPQEEKYRQLKLSNLSVQNNLLIYPGVRDFLISLGFEDNDYRLFMPQPSTYDMIRIYRNQLFVVVGDSASSMYSMTLKSNNNVSLDELVEPHAVSGESTLNRTRNTNHQQHHQKSSPVTLTSSEIEFFSSIEAKRKIIKLYNDPDLAEIVAALVDVDSYKEANLSQEAVLKRLMRWFKFEFFSWFSPPVCESCKTPYVCRETVAPTPTEARWLAHTVELYQTGCSCAGTVGSDTSYRFPRYNHPEQLLSTRTGRCGEWANCFSLLLRVLGGGGRHNLLPTRARFIMDLTDHVWCEIFLQRDRESEPRWIHVDPCECEIDKPHLYEAGWGKKLTYVLGIDLDSGDVQDVTWRYVVDHKATLSRRSLVRESVLVSRLLDYHTQTGTVVKETLQELVQLLPGGKSNIGHQFTESLPGRTTGSLEWRQQRGETGALPHEQHQHQEPLPEWAKNHSGSCIRPTVLELQNGCLHIQYNCSVDAYSRPCDRLMSDKVSGKGEVGSTSSSSGGRASCNRRSEMASSSSTAALAGNTNKNKNDLLSHDTDGWQHLAAHWRNIKRKVEYDWQIVYLARINSCPSSASGEISWTVDVSNTGKQLGEISVFASSAEFHNATVKWRLHSGGTETPVNGFVTTTEFVRCDRVTLTAQLCSNVDENASEDSSSASSAAQSNAWQHAQLCRQKSTDFDVKTLQIKVELLDHVSSASNNRS